MCSYIIMAFVTFMKVIYKYIPKQTMSVGYIVLRIYCSYNHCIYNAAFDVKSSVLLH